MATSNDFVAALRRALDALSTEIADESDLDAVDTGLAESELCSWDELKAEDADGTDGLAAAIRLVGERLDEDPEQQELDDVVEAALSLEEIQRLCSYDGSPDANEIEAAEVAREKICAWFEALIAAEEEDDDDDEDE